MNLHKDEPVFVLRAADKFAPETIFAWARTVVQNPDATESQFKQAAQACLVAKAMEDWQKANPHLVKLPDFKEASIDLAKVIETKKASF